MGESFLLILAGPPGSGKTTVGPLVAARFEPSVSLQSDFFWASIVRGLIPPWDQEAGVQNRQMVRMALASARAFTRAGYVTVLEGDYGPWYFDLVEDELRDLDVPVSYVVLRPGVEECLRRAVDRTSEAKHRGALTLEDPIRRLCARFEHLKAYEKHVLDNAQLTLDETVAAVVERVRDADARLTLA